jgi:DNA polymerase I
MVTFVGHAFNPRSPQQVAEILYDEMRLPVIRGRSTDKDHLRRLEQYNELPAMLLDYRKYQKLLSTYISSLWKHIGPDGRIHTEFKPHGTVTGRLSSSSPNLQNIPEDPDNPWAVTIKNFFVASSGMTFIYLDYKQVELAMLAFLSQDPWLKSVYIEGRDLHDETAEAIFGEGFTQKQRVFAKGINFGLAYGRSADAIAADTNLGDFSLAEAQLFAQNYFDRIPRVVEFIEQTHRHVDSTGYVELPSGRRRRFPIRTRETLVSIHNEAMNFLCQGGSADIMLKALIYGDRRLEGRAYQLLSVHDSLLIEAPVETADEIKEVAARFMMEAAMDLYGDEVPFRVEAAWGDKWGSLKHVDLETTWEEVAGKL